MRLRSHFRALCDVVATLSRDWRVSLAVGIAFAIGVCYPIIGGRRLLLLDWVLGPRSPILSPSLVGLNGGITAGSLGVLPFDILNRLVGAAATWLPLVIFFPLASTAIGHLVGGSRLTRTSSAVLYCANPFVYDRIYVGHLPLLIGYALLPFAVGALLRGAHWSAVALWWAALTALSPHYLWIYGLCIVTHAIMLMKRQTLSDGVQLLTFSATACFAMCSYVWLPVIADRNIALAASKSALSLFRTTSDPRLGLLPNVLGLYGFWRNGTPILPKNIFAGWPFIAAGILIVAGMGFWHLMRTRNRLSQHAMTLAIVGVFGCLLAMGSQGPTGMVFRLLYFHVPFFDIMREPQKFLMLLVLTYSVFFGHGIDHLACRVPRVGKSRLAPIALGLGLPIAYTPTIFAALWGQVLTSTIPASYGRAASLTGQSSGYTLALPWHEYMGYPFTSGRVVANVASSFLSGTIISPDDLEVRPVKTLSTNPESRDITSLLRNASHRRNIGIDLARLGIEYVALEDPLNWTKYSWLEHQKHLTPLLNRPSLEVWRNDAYHGISRWSPATTGAKRSSVQIDQLSAGAYRVSASGPGRLTLDIPYTRAWTYHGHSAIETAAGTVEIRVQRGSGELVSSTWIAARDGYGITFGAACGACAVAAFRRRRRHTRARSDRQRLPDVEPIVMRVLGDTWRTPS